MIEDKDLEKMKAEALEKERVLIEELVPQFTKLGFNRDKITPFIDLWIKNTEAMFSKQVESETERKIKQSAWKLLKQSGKIRPIIQTLRFLFYLLAMTTVVGYVSSGFTFPAFLSPIKDSYLLLLVIAFHCVFKLGTAIATATPLIFKPDHETKIEVNKELLLRRADSAKQLLNSKKQDNRLDHIAKTTLKAAFFLLVNVVYGSIYSILSVSTIIALTRYNFTSGNQIKESIEKALAHLNAKKAFETN